MSQQHAQNTVRIASITDAVLIRFLDDLAKKFAPSKFGLTAGIEGLGEFSNAEALDQAHPLKDFEDTRIISVAHAQLLGGKITVHFHRFVSEFGNPIVRVQSPWEVEVWLQRSNQPAPTPAESLAVMRRVDEFRAASLGPGAPPASHGDVLDVVKRQLADLTALHAQIVHDAERERLLAQRTHDERLAALEAVNAETRAQIERDAADRAAKLAEQEAHLVAQQKALDDRGHMHFRRSLRAQITEEMQKRMSKPPTSAEVSTLRGTIVFWSLAGIALLVGVSAYGAWDTHALVTKATADPYLLAYATARFGVPLAVATGLLVYLLNWLRRIHSEDVRAERDLERYRFDIDRASWAVETILEGQSANGTKVPEVWIAGAVQGLFARSDVNDAEENARDALAALLGFSARAQVGSDGAQLEFGRGDLKKLSRLGDAS